MLFTNVGNLGFSSASFDLAICGFMGWNDCFDFHRLEFTHPDSKGEEIWRVLRHAGRFVCCSWESQDDLAWMEQAMLRHYPGLLEDHDFLQQRPIGMAQENAAGYRIIFESAGFTHIQVARETAEFVSTDEEEWWREMQHLGWGGLLDKIKLENPGEFQSLKPAILHDLHPYKQADGIHFSKTVFFISGVK